MRLSRLALYLALFAFVGREPAHATEIAPTPKMLADAREMNAARWPDDKGTEWEFHFRNVDGHVLWCAYATGGNGGFCQRLAPGYVARVDRSAAEECAKPDAGPWLAHSEKCVLIAKSSALSTFDLASSYVGAVRRRAGGSQADGSSLPRARCGRRLDLNRQQSGGCRSSSVKREHAMPKSEFFAGIYDLIVVGRGTAAAAYLDTADFDQLFPMSKTITVLVVGEIDAWDPKGPRGRTPSAQNAPNNKINQPWHMIDYFSQPIQRYAAGGWEVMVNRDDFSAKTKEIISSIRQRNNKLNYRVESRKILGVENTCLSNEPKNMYNGYAVRTIQGVKKETYFGHNVVLATGAGPHRPPQFATDFNNSWYVRDSGSNFKDRVVDMDHFARIAQTLRSEWDRMGATQKLRVAVCGPNASLDTVELAGFQGFQIVRWLVPKNARPIVLGTAHQTHSSALATSAIEYDGEDKVKIAGVNRNTPLSFGTKASIPETKGNKVVDQKVIKGEIKIVTQSVSNGRIEDLVDYVIYGLGQDAELATDYISTSIKNKLTPIFDKNQRFGDVTASVLGFQSENYVWATGKNVQNNLMVVGALSAQVANDVPMTKAKDAILKDIAEMINSTRRLLIDDVDTKGFILNATTQCMLPDRISAWNYFIYEDYRHYDKGYLVKQMHNLDQSLEFDCGSVKLSEEYKKLERRTSALFNLISSYIDVAKDFDQQMDAVRNKYQDKPERWNAKFWQSMLDRPSSKMTSSQAGSAQILGIMSAMAAINGFAPNFAQREQAGQHKSWADVVSANQDDRTALRIAIAVCYPLVPEEKAKPIIERVIAMRKIGSGKDFEGKKRDGFGVSPQDMEQFHNELILASTQLHQLNREEVSKLKGMA